MQGKWKEWEHSAVKTAVLCPALTLCEHIPHLLRERRREAFKSANLEGERGEAGFERDSSSLGLPFTPAVNDGGGGVPGSVKLVVLKWRALIASSNAGDSNNGGSEAVAAVRQRRRSEDGILPLPPPEKTPNLAQLPGL